MSIVEAHQVRVGDVIRKMTDHTEYSWATVSGYRHDYAVTNGTMALLIVHLETEHGAGWVMGDVRLERKRTA